MNAMLDKEKTLEEVDDWGKQTNKRLDTSTRYAKES